MPPPHNTDLVNHSSLHFGDNIDEALPGFVHPLSPPTSGGYHDDTIDFRSLDHFLIEKGLHKNDEAAQGQQILHRDASQDGNTGEAMMEHHRPPPPSPPSPEESITTTMPTFTTTEPTNSVHASSKRNKTSLADKKNRRNQREKSDYAAKQTPHYRELMAGTGNKTELFDLIQRYMQLSGNTSRTCRARLRRRITRERADDLYSDDPARQAKAIHELALEKDEDILNWDEKRVFHQSLKPIWDISNDNVRRRLREGIRKFPHAAALLRSGRREDLLEAARLMDIKKDYPKNRATTSRPRSPGKIS